MHADELAKGCCRRKFVDVSFAEIRPQIEQLPHDEMVKTLAYLKSRLRAETDANSQELSRLNAEIDGGRKISWVDLKRQLGLS
jgi:hypothetical protein